MGSLQQLSTIKGPQRDLKQRRIHQIFEQTIADACKKTALIDWNPDSGSEKRTNYAQLNKTANRYARTLIEQIRSAPNASANRDGDWIVAVCMPPSERLVTTLLAIWKAGAAYLPIDVTFPVQRIEHILDEARPAMVVYDQFDKAEVAFQGTMQMSAEELERRSMDVTEVDNVGAAETLSAGRCDLAIVLYTSGSTGVPKGVRMPHSIIQNRLQWQFDAFPYADSEQTCVFKTALTFVDSVAELWGPLLNQLAVLIIPKEVTKDPERLVEALEAYQIERLVLVPTLLRSLLMYLPLKNQPGLLHNLKIWVCSGEALSTQLATEFFDYFVEGQHVLCNFYGSTEITGDVSYFVCTSKRQLAVFDKVPIGYPISNTVLYLLDGDMRPVKMGQTGELFVAGANLAAGYVNGRDKFRFVENPMASDPRYNYLYRTGDYASVLKGGAIQYEGRTDSQIKIRGHRVDLSEVERHLFAIQAVDKGLVLCYHAGEIDQALLAFVTVADGAGSLTGLQIESSLGTKLADYMVPQVIVVDTIPLLVNGKVDRQTLLRMYENTNNNDETNVELTFDFSGVPKDQLDMARDLFSTIGAAIGRSTRSSISIESNFYQLGGNSLNSIYTVAQLRNQGYMIGISDFISAKTLRSVLDKMSGNIDNGITSSSDANDGASTDLGLRATALLLTHKSEVIELLTRSFFEKADLENWLKPLIKYTDYGDLFEEIFEHLVEKDISFVVMDEQDRMVGVALNMDAHNEPDVNITSSLSIIFEFLEFVEGPIRDNQLPAGHNQIFHASMMGTSAQLNAQENITVMQFMEDEVLEVAARKGFAGIFTTNTSPLTQQLGTHVYGYETLLNYQVNQYIAPDGTRPFGKAPDSQRAIVQWKRIA